MLTGSTRTTATGRTSLCCRSQLTWVSRALLLLNDTMGMICYAGMQTALATSSCSSLLPVVWISVRCLVVHLRGNAKMSPG